MPWDVPDPRTRDPMVQRGMDLIGAALRRRRERRGLSQRDLERLTGVDQSTISKLENGRRCGLRWPRFALMVATLDGLDFDGATDQGGSGAPAVPSLRQVRARQLAQDEADLLAAQIAAGSDHSEDFIDEPNSSATVEREPAVIARAAR